MARRFELFVLGGGFKGTPQENQLPGPSNYPYKWGVGLISIFEDPGPSVVALLSVIL